MLAAVLSWTHLSVWVHMDGPACPQGLPPGVGLGIEKTEWWAATSAAAAQPWAHGFLLPVGGGASCVLNASGAATSENRICGPGQHFRAGEAMTMDR